MNAKRRIARLMAAAALLAAACSISTPAPVPESSPGDLQTATPTPFEPLAADTPISETGPPAPVEDPQPPAGQETGFFGLVVPQNWFYSMVENGNVSALVFTPIDPDTLAAFSEPGLLVPPDFSIAALVRSPLPEGANADALQAGMNDAINNMTDDDFLSLLAGAEQIGIIDPSAFEGTALSAASPGKLGGETAISVTGSLLPGNGLRPVVQVQVYLAWTDAAFYTFYAIHTEAAAGAAEADLAVSLASIDLP